MKGLNISRSLLSEGKMTIHNIDNEINRFSPELMLRYQLQDFLTDSNPSALDLISAEREKQISKGYTVEHDAAYVQRTKVTFDMIAINLVNRYQCPPEWDQAYWDGLCNLPRPDRIRIAATWMARELERIIHLEKEATNEPIQ